MTDNPMTKYQELLELVGGFFESGGKTALIEFDDDEQAAVSAIRTAIGSRPIKALRFPTGLFLIRTDLVTLDEMTRYHKMQWEGRGR